MTMYDQKPQRRIARFIGLTLFVLSIVAAALPISSLDIDNRLEIWAFQDDPALKSFDRGHALFGDWNWMSLYLVPKDNIYTDAFLQSVATLSDEIEALPNVRKVISIANARGNRIDNDELTYQPILGRAPWSADDLAQLRLTLESHLIYRNGLIKPDGVQNTLVLVQVANRVGDKGNYRIELINAINKLVQNRSTAIDDFALVGSPYLNAEANRSSRHDMLLFYPLVTLLVTVSAWLVFRNFRDIAVVLTTLLGATAWSVGLMMSHYELNMVTIMMPTVLVTVAVANVMHMIVTFHHQRRAQPALSVDQVARDTVRSLWAPSLGTTATTAAGFLSLTQTGILPVTLLGYFAAAGIVFAYLLTLFLVPTLLCLFWGSVKVSETPVRRVGSATGAPRWSMLYEKTSFRHPYLVLTLFALVSGLVLSRLPALDADTNYVDLFGKDTESQHYYRTVEDNGYAASSLTLLVHAPQGLEDVAVFKSVQALETKMEALPHVRNVASPVKLIAEVDRALAEDKAAWTPDFHGYGRDALAQLILTAEISGNDDLSDLLSSDHKDFQLTVFTDNLSSQSLAHLSSNIENLARASLPQGVTAASTGLAVLWSDMDQHLLASQSNILLSMVGPLFLIMLAIIRSVPLVVIGLIVNLLPVGLILGLMAWTNIKVDMATILIGGITMGIAVDDTIHFLWQFRGELLKGKSFQDAVSLTFDHTGTAILMTAFLLSSGFLVMASSDFTPTSHFGWLTSLTVVIALVAELFLMPTLLFLLKPGKEHLSLLYVPFARRLRGKVIEADPARGDS